MLDIPGWRRGHPHSKGSAKLVPQAAAACCCKPTGMIKQGRRGDELHKAAVQLVEHTDET